MKLPSFSHYVAALMSVKKTDCQLSVQKYPSRVNNHCNSFSAGHGQNFKQHLEDGYYLAQ